MGQGEYCEIQYGDGPTILVYGPFDEQRKLELEFDHVGDDDDEDKSNAKIIKDKIIEVGISFLCCFAISVYIDPGCLHVVERRFDNEHIHCTKIFIQSETHNTLIRVDFLRQRLHHRQDRHRLDHHRCAL